MQDPRPVIVIGGGISGMAAAWGVHQAGLPVCVLESGSAVGGVVRSEAAPEGFTLDLGPQTLSTRDPALLADLEALGLGPAGQLRASPAAGERFVVMKGRPTRIPTGPADLLKTPLLSATAKLGLLRSPFRKVPEAWKKDPSRISIRDFATWALGAEVADRLVDPFVSGVYAGDPAKVSVAAILPELTEVLLSQGTLFGAIRGMRRGERQEGERPSRLPRGIFSFPGGLQVWPQAVAGMLGPGGVRTHATVEELSPAPQGWRVRWASKLPDGNVEIHEVEARGVVLATPAHTTAEFLRDLPGAREAVPALRGIPSAPVAVVHLAWPRDQVAHPVRGFGLLAPSGEGRGILGSLWPAGLFPGKAPEDQVLTANFVGGARYPERVELEDGPLTELVAGELKSLLGARGTPSLVRVSRWLPGIPQYTSGHMERIAAAAALEGKNPGLRLIGSWRGGVSLGDCWAQGTRAGRALAEGLG